MFRRPSGERNDIKHSAISTLGFKKFQEEVPFSKLVAATAHGQFD